MSSYKGEINIKRNLIHVVMIVLAAISVVPLYTLLINATRTTEQINTGISLFPGNGAFWNRVEDLPAPVVATVSGTVKYEDMIPGSSLLESRGKKRINEFLSVIHDSTKKPKILIVDNEGNTLETLNLLGGSYLDVNDGQSVRAGDVIAGKVLRPPNVIYNWKALTGRGFKMWQGFGNSAFISICVTLLSVYFSAMTAYGLHVYRFRGRLLLWTVILVIMMLPGTLTFIGFYQFMARIRLTNSYIPLIIPSIAAAATVLFIRQYMLSVLSIDLIDAARIDGANEYHIFNVIILPVTIPALAAQAIFTFVGSWNSFITPFVLISRQDRYTLPMLVQTLRGDIYRTEFGGIYLGIAISLIPILIFYAFMSRYIISGLTMGGLKE